MQYIWKPYSEFYDQSGSIFTHSFFNKYLWPDEFNLSNEEQKITNLNLVNKTRTFIEFVKTQLQPAYKGNELLVLMGDDFNYWDAEDNYS